MPIPLAVAAIPAIAQGAYGIAQLFKGSKLAREAKRPEYQIPDEIKANLSQAELLSFEGLPAEQKRQYIENLERQQGFQAGLLKSRSAGVSGAAQLGQTYDDALRNLMGQDVAARQANIGTLMQQRGVMAGYKDKAFDINQMQPYMEQAKAAESLKGAGLQNVYGGISSGIRTALGADMMKRLLGTGDQADKPTTGVIKWPEVEGVYRGGDQGTGGYSTPVDAYLAALGQQAPQQQQQLALPGWQESGQGPLAPAATPAASPEIQELVAMLGNPFITPQEAQQVRAQLALMGYKR